ncbi:MAG: RsmB/NOP family class I SAM-dependent RNA methyltransferase [Verrucomicrobia bacterium]|nr:RsmB/NOP family class I SAM-dependent RNA methyltransferase [Verrucomicrobiota bacterium]
MSPRLLRPQINPLDVAAAVIRKADREHPADAVLREELRANGAIYRSQSAEVSRAVFAYYRWFGWLDQRHPLAGQIKHALDLATAFAERPDSFSDEKLMQRCLPAWIAAHMEVTADWVRSLQREPSLWIRARRGFTAALRKSLVKTAKSPLPEALRYAGKEDLFRRPEFQDGEFEIQDIASQVVSLLCDPQPGETWWDACAGEGGKTLHLSDLMQNKGLIWASDRADWRLKRLKLRTGRAKCFNYRTVFWDGGEKPPTKTKFDGVLVDAPCAGLGTWQRNPHARWTLTLDDVRELAAIQKTLLSHVAGSVKPGGKLLYAVCTLSREETTEVAKFADEQLADFEPLPLPDLLHAGGPAAPVRWFWPQDLGGNGMFVAAWRRRSAAVKDPSPTPGTSSTP